MNVKEIRKVALVGSGIMGAEIGAHVLSAGYELTVYTRTASSAEGLLAKGASWAQSPAAAASSADVVLTCVGLPQDVEEVYLGSDGILGAARKGTWLVDLTTSSPSLARDIHEAAQVDGINAVDCPMTCGQHGAQAGPLTLFVGATEDYVAPIMSVLETFSSKRFFFGSAGAGQSAKLCNQVALAANMAGMCDAMALAEQSGLDIAQVREAIMSGMGGSVALDNLGARVLEEDWNPGFLSTHMRKDLVLALIASEDLDITLPATETSYILFDTLCKIGGARLGTQALALLYRDEASAVAAGLDWSVFAQEQPVEEEHHCCGGHGHGEGHGDGCCGGHGHGHGHGEGHGDGCCGGHAHGEGHGDGCCGGHGHGHGGGHHCHHDHDEER